MKIASLLVLCGLAYFSALAQVTSPFYYDDYWQITTRDKAVYFRTSILDTAHLVFSGGVKDYFRDGQLQMSGRYQMGLRHGRFEFYYPNGQTNMKGNYDLGRRVGEWLYYYSDGALRQRVEFTEGSFYVWEYYDSLGNALVNEGTGRWQNSYYELDNPKKITIEGEFLNGRKSGEWKCYDEDGRQYYVEKFRRGRFVRGSVVDPKDQHLVGYDSEIHNKIPSSTKLHVTEQFIFADEEAREQYPHLEKLKEFEIAEGTEVGVQPEYPGGMQRLYRFVANNLTYPQQARQKGIQGKVFIQFVIDKDGSITQVKTIKGIGGGCDQEAERVIKNIENWKPGYIDGEPVRVRMILPITFSLGSSTRNQSRASYD
ncbi:MAG: TonB family protein [Bacteroidota bacterium]